MTGSDRRWEAGAGYLLVQFSVFDDNPTLNRELLTRCCVGHGFTSSSDIGSLLIQMVLVPSWVIEPIRNILKRFGFRFRFSST